jgi:hypothetical protein
MSTPSQTSLAELLPRRPIIVRPPSTVEGGTVGVILLLLIGLGGVVAALGPDIANDWRMRHDAVVAPDVRVREAQCRSWLGVLRFCNFTLATGEGDGAHDERRLWYAFFGGADDQAVVARRSASDASRVGTDLGLAKVFSRLLVLLLLAGIVLFCIAVAATVLWRGISSRRAFAAMSGQRLMPVVVEIERNNRLPPRRRLWVYLYEKGGKPERGLAEWPSNRQPLFTTLNEGWALALRGDRDSGMPMLLDADLACLDLTEAERAAFHRAFAARFGVRAGEKAAV